ncbi:MAG: hypothetical protein ACK4JX_00175 [Flavobacterium sp.]
MNPNQPNNTSTEQEIDLSKIGYSINSWLQNISLSIFKVLQFFKKNALIIGILFIIGAASGWFADQKIKSYSHQLILSSNFGSTDYVYSKFDLLNAKIKDRDTTFLKELGFAKTKHIGKFKIKPIIDVYQFIDGKAMNFEFLKLMAEDGDLKKIITDNITSKNYPHHLISFGTGKTFDSNEIITPLINYLNDSDHFKQLQKEYLRNMDIKLKANDSIISQIDQLLAEFSKNTNSSKSSSLVFYNENTQINDLLATKNSLINESGALRVQLVNMDKIAKESAVFINIPNKGGFNGKLKYFIPVLLIVLFSLFRGFKKWSTKMKEQL